jgi:conjugative transfer signal peptidase TraF
MREKDSVVWQGKGSGSHWPVGPGFRWFPHDFWTGHSGTAEIIVTHDRWVTMTRGISKHLPGNWQRTRRVLSTAAAVITGAILLDLTGGFLNLRIMLTDSSAPAGVYRLKAVQAGRGVLAAACLPAAIARTGLACGYLQKGDCPAAAEPVAKVIGAVSGDVVDLEPGWVAINGVKFPNSQTALRDSAGRPLSHAPWGTRRVDAGEVWLFGFNDARSWDARYFGAVPAAGVRGVLRPVVTW